MISLVLKNAGVSYPASGEMVEQIDRKLEEARAQGHEVQAIRMPYGYLSTLEEAGLIAHDRSHALYKGIKILVN